MTNLISYITRMDMEYKANTRLDMLTRDGSPGHVHMINYFTKYRTEIFQYAIIKSDAKPSCIVELTISHLHSYLGMRGYIKGLGAMSAEENKMRMGIAWEEKYAEFKRCVEMPERGTYLYNWQKTQLKNGLCGLDAKIRKEIAENEGSTVWCERRVKLSDCVEQMIDAKRGNAWEKRYAEFVSYDGMPKKGTPLYTWQQNELNNSHNPSCLNAKIWKELAENKGSIWSDRRVKLAKCVEQKRCESLSTKSVPELKEKLWAVGGRSVGEGEEEPAPEEERAHCPSSRSLERE